MTDINTFDPNHIEPLTVSDSAIEHIKQQLAKNADSVGFRLYVSKAGCSGLMYKVGYVINIIPTDLVFPVDDELNIYVDVYSYPFVKGTHIDIQKQGLNVVLTYKNPNAQGNCGCGESFIVEGDAND